MRGKARDLRGEERGVFFSFFERKGLDRLLEIDYKDLSKARVVELVDTLVLEASAKSVGVRVPPRAPILNFIYSTSLFLNFFSYFGFISVRGGQFKNTIKNKHL